MEKLKLNNNKSYYLSKEYGVVVSSFEEDILFESTCVKKIILALIEENISYFDLASLLSSAFIPSEIFNTVNQLLQSGIIEKYAETETETETETYINIKSKSIAISSSYFENFLFGKDADFFLTISPNDEVILFSNSDTICFECLKKRLLSHRPLLGVVSYYGSEQKRLSIPKKSNTKLAHDLFYKYKFDKGKLYTLKNNVQLDSFSPNSFQNCDICRNNYGHEFERFVDELFMSRLDPDLGYRSVNPEETIERLLPLVNPHMGIISKLSPYREINSNLIFNYSSGRNQAFSGGDKFWLKNYIRSSNGGKGKSPLQAKAGALAEAVERYSMVYQGNKNSIYTAFSLENDLRLIHPNTCLLFSSEQYKQEKNDSTAFHQIIPEKFENKKMYHWYKAFSLTKKSECYLPGSIAYAKHTEESNSKPYAYPDSNGCSAGNNYTEAALQGSLELIERDAAAIWWYNKCLRSRVSMKNISNNYITEILKYYHKIERKIHIIDITTDLGIPCFVAISYNANTKKEILYGFGCHLDYRIALERCIVEVNQLLPITMTKKSKTSDQELYKWLESVSISDHEYLLGKEDSSVDINKQYAHLLEDKSLKPISIIINKLKNSGIELIAFDLKQQDTNFPVVKMIAPGLRHFWRRTAEGRLYDIPIKMGWLKNKLKENELNPYSITI